MKLEKDKVQRRVDLLAEEGIEFITEAHIGPSLNQCLAALKALPQDLPSKAESKWKPSQQPPKNK